MSTNEVKLSPISFKNIVIKQYLYKLKGHSGLIYSLIFVQLISVLFSMGTMSGMSSGGEFLHVTINTHSEDVFLIFAFIWMIVVTSFLGSQAYRSMDFSLVTSRKVSHATNMLLILTYALYAGITGTLMSLLQRMIMVQSLEGSEFIFGGLQIPLQDLILGVFVLTLYLLLLASVTYLIQMVSVLNKASGIALFIFFFAFGLGTVRIFGFDSANILHFYTEEGSLGLFVFKVVCSVVLLLGLSMLIARRMEVKR